MNRSGVHAKINALLLMLTAFSLPFAFLTPVFIILTVINWIVEGDLGSKLKRLASCRYYFLFVSLYLVHLIGLVYTNNMDAGLFSLQVKLSIFVLPTILLSAPLSVKTKNFILQSFIAGCFLASVTLIVIASYYFLFYGSNRFFYQEFSIIMHLGYFSMYLNTAVALLLLFILDSEKNAIFTLLSVSKFGAFLVIVFFSLVILLLSSKMGILCLMLLLNGAAFYYAIVRKNYLKGLAVFILIAAFALFAFRFLPEMSARINRSVAAVVVPKENKNATESTAVRLLIWPAANKVISENLFLGVGTGDGKDKLLAEYCSRGMEDAFKLKLNAHNEYYEITLALGLMGLIILLCNLVLPLAYAVKKSALSYVLFLVIIILNFCTESMLEREAGVVFYAFFNSLLFIPESEEVG